MSNELTVDQQIAARLKTIFPDPQIASRIVNLVVGEKPNGWGRKSYAPYYKEIFGLQMKKLADEMLASHAPVLFRYDEFCGEEEVKCSRLTLYNRINQSIRYLTEKLDTPDGKYKAWYSMIHVQKWPLISPKKIGIRLGFMDGIFQETQESFTPQTLVKDKDGPKWKREMDAWIENDEEFKPFIQEGLALTEEQIKELKLRLAPLETIAAHITSSTVKLIRMR